MSEILKPSTCDVDQVTIDRNYLTSENVRSRFGVYEFEEPYTDLEKLAVDSLELTNSTKDLVDIGAADGDFLYRLRWEFNLQGKLTGVEPNSSQYDLHATWKEPTDIGLIKRTLDNYYVEPSSSHEVLTEASYLADNPCQIELLEGRAHDLSKLDSKSADVLFAMFMLYHLTEEQRPMAMQEFKRVLKPDGTFVMATSGVGNKPKHRVFEEKIADALGNNVKAPKPMNAGFVTEKAVAEVPKYFKHVYLYNHAAHIVIGRTGKSLGAYYNSLRSHRDQFEPVPTEEEFNNAVRTVVDKPMLSDLSKHGGFRDAVARAVLVASDVELDEHRLVEHGFKKIT